jgi:hypothetical protein
MTEHIFLSINRLEELKILPEYKKWIQSWMENKYKEIDNGNISSSSCIQGVLSEIILHGKPVSDWCGIIDEYLVDEQGKPLAYSESYGKRLYSFNQWKQNPIHAIHARWWIEKTCNRLENTRHEYRRLIESNIQPSGWIYDPKVSNTGIRTRMKTELMMSMAMGVEILKYYNQATRYSTRLLSTISTQALTGFVGAEYFRLRALAALDSAKLMPAGIEHTISSCEAGKGYCDFSLESKVDDYMGTEKRVTRDKPVHSAISSLHVQYLSNLCALKTKQTIGKRLQEFGRYLISNPFDLPAFRMRDIEIPFGTDITPLEIIAASKIISLI